MRLFVAIFSVFSRNGLQNVGRDEARQVRSKADVPEAFGRSPLARYSHV